MINNPKIRQPPADFTINNSQKRKSDCVKNFARNTPHYQLLKLLLQHEYKITIMRCFPVELHVQ
ncbi:MAG: hypothetical protein LBU34_18240 [Planctomycetaceae bacterium]|nr:hypothetical protein [Planctomycetaceae bacterium]